MIREIVLHKQLADNGERQVIRLDVDNTVIMFRGLNQLVDGFDQKLRTSTSTVKVMLESGTEDSVQYIHEAFISRNFGEAKTIHVIPEVTGGGPMIVTYFAGAAFAATTAGMILGFVINMGVSMLLGAVANALSPKPSTAGASSQGAAAAPSYMFSGVLNVSNQGGPVTLAYGRHLVGSTVISVGADVKNIL